MKPSLLPALDARVAQQIRDEILARRPAYVRDWLPSEDGPDAALTGIAARYLEGLLQRLNLAPEKNRLAFLDLLGIDLVPAQAARVPLVFQLAENGQAVTLPAGARVAAPPPPESTQQIVFETERSAGLSPARLRQVVSLWPGRDQYIDHSSDFVARKPIDPFRRALLVDTPHVLYIAHDTLLHFDGKVQLDVQVELVESSSETLSITWEYWDGAVWRGFVGMRPGCEGPTDKSPDGTAGLTRSGRFRLEADCAETAKTTINGVEAYWIRGRLTEPLPLDPTQVLPVVDDVKLLVHVTRPLPEPPALFFIADETPIGRRTFTTFPAPASGGARPAQAVAAPAEAAGTGGLEPETAFAGAEKLDTSKAFFPFGQAPRPGDTFYFESDEIFTKPGAEATVRVLLTEAAPPGDLRFSEKTPLTPEVEWEYWNGRRWEALAIVAPDPQATDRPDLFTHDGTFRFHVPDDIAATKVNDQEGRWIRARLASGGFGFTATAHFKTLDVAGLEKDNTMTYVVPQAPAVAEFRLGYSWEYGPFPAERVLTYNDFQYADRTQEAKWPGLTFAPFEQVSGSTPALYLGFDRKLPVDRINLFFDCEEKRGDVRGPDLVWESFNGFDWAALTTDDETSNLRVPGMVSLIGPEDAASTARFGTSLYWLRARLKEDGPPGEPTLLGIFHNAVWASQWETVVNEVVGTASGVPHQALAFRRFPVLVDEHLEIQELTGARANVEWRILAREVLGVPAIRDLEELLGREGSQTEIEKAPLRLRRDRNKRVIEAWVRWEPREDFLRSTSRDRHYVLERSRGKLLFGSGAQGRVPPPGATVLARSYRTGGGSQGNVATGAVKQILAGVAGLEAAWNPRPAEGGADAETIESLAARGPLTLARRGRGISAAGIESLARQISPAVAVARVVPTFDPSGRQRPGWVTLILIPHSEQPRPWPSLGLRDRVRRAVEARAAADFAAARHLHVTGPDYLPIDVEVTVTPVDPDDAGGVDQRVRSALQSFLHPLRGGPERAGWTPGRDVYLSDVAATVERTEGVDYVREIALLVEGQLQGERVAVRPDRIVVAGTLRVRLV